MISKTYITYTPHRRWFSRTKTEHLRTKPRGVAFVPLSRSLYREMFSGPAKQGAKYPEADKSDHKANIQAVDCSCASLHTLSEMVTEVFG